MSTNILLTTFHLLQMTSSCSLNVAKTPKDENSFTAKCNNMEHSLWPNTEITQRQEDINYHDS